MRIKMDTASVRFMITKTATAKWDKDAGRQKVDKATGALLWQVQLMALDESGGEILTVTVDSEPKFNVGEYVLLHDLVAIPWGRRVTGPGSRSAPAR